jgi:hypothetical protein
MIKENQNEDGNRDLSQCHCGACFGKKKQQGEKGSNLEANKPWATALSGLMLVPGDGQTVGSEAEPETGQTVGSEAEPEPSLVRGVLSVLLLLPGDGKTVGIKAESETMKTVDSEAKPEPS